MRDISVKQDNVGDTLTAEDFNALNEEIENIIKSAGFTLDPAGGPDTNKNMLGQTGAAYGSAAWRYADSGTANAKVLSRVASSSLKDVAILHDGMGVAFEVGVTNTGATTINVAGLGAKAVVIRGSALTGGELTSGEQCLAFYSLANDRFDIVPMSGDIIDGTVTLAKLSDSATESANVVRRVAKAWVNFTGTGVVAINDDFNVSSITDVAVGKYQINLTSAMNDTNYCVNPSCSHIASATLGSSIGVEESLLTTASVINLIAQRSSGLDFDPARVYCSIFGEQ